MVLQNIRHPLKYIILSWMSLYQIQMKTIENMFHLFFIDYLAQISSSVFIRRMPEQWRCGSWYWAYVPSKNFWFLYSQEHSLIQAWVCTHRPCLKALRKDPLLPHRIAWALSGSSFLPKVVWAVMQWKLACQWLGWAILLRKLSLLHRSHRHWTGLQQKWCMVLLGPS